MSTIWDVNIVFNYFINLGTDLTEKQLSQKLCVLLLLLGGQRVNTIHSFRIDKMSLSDSSVTFSPGFVLKHSRKGSKLDTFTYKAYKEDHRLCVIECLKKYLHSRKDKVGDTITELIITYGKPYKAASIDTIRRWIKELFENCGLTNFSPHSCRSASTSKAHDMGVDVQTIMKKACWKNCGTFYNHYKTSYLTMKKKLILMSY